jgi:lysophospholipase L1-like esterase
VNFSLRLLDFEPDVLIVLHNINDLSALDYGDELLPDYSNKYLSDSFLAYEHRTGAGATLLQLSRGLQLIRWQSTWLQNALEYSPRNGYLHSADRGRQLFRRNLESIIAVARQHGVRVILTTQGHRDDEQGAFAAYNEETRRVAFDHAVPLADAAKAMNGRRELFLDPVHMSAKGVTALAAVMEPVLEASLRDIIAAQSLDCAGSAAIAISRAADPPTDC